uniref:Aa_trans domain-containing protein n=1 Tax=Macrostomum lignano TaxID=282301 RepID=A0A1I8HJE3_9PLAT
LQCWEPKRLLGRWTPGLAVVLAICEIFCIGGVFYGFSSSLRLLLLAEGFFADGCNISVAVLASGNETCRSQNEGFSQVNAVGTGMQLLCALPMGLLLDRAGMRACKCACAAAGFLTCLCFAVASPASAWLLYIGAASWAVASAVSIVSSLCASELFPAWRETVAYGTGLDDASAMYRRRLACFLFLGCLAATVCLVNGLVLLPPKHIRHGDQFAGECNPFSACSRKRRRPKQAIFELKEPLEHDPRQAVAADAAPAGPAEAADAAATDAAADSEVTPLDAAVEPVAKEIEVKTTANVSAAAEAAAAVTPAAELPPVQSVLLTRMFGCHVIWAVCSILRFFVFLNQVALYVRFAVDGSVSDVSLRAPTMVRHLSLLGVFLSLGLCFAFFTVGVVRFSRRFWPPKPAADVWQRCRFLVCSLGLLLSCLSFAAHDGLVPLQFTLLALYRSMLFSLASCLLFAAFPAAHFGTLYGVMCLACGLVSFVQIPLLDLAEASGLSSANWVCLALALAAYAHPVQILLADRIPCGAAVPGAKRRSGPTSENLLA